MQYQRIATTSAQARAGQPKASKGVCHKKAFGPAPLAGASGCLALLILATPSEARTAEVLAAMTLSEEPSSSCILPTPLETRGGLVTTLAAPDGGERFAAPRTLACPATHSQFASATQSSSSSLSSSSHFQAASVDLPGSEQQQQQPAAVEEAATAALEAPGAPAASMELAPTNPAAHACDIARLRGPLPYTAHISSRLSYTICGMRSSAVPALPGRSA